MINEGYSICFNRWALDERIKNELNLLLIISSLSSINGVCCASNKFFADLFKIDEKTISRKINKLIETRYLLVEYEKIGSKIQNRKLRLNTNFAGDKKITGDKFAGDKKITGVYNIESRVYTNNKLSICRELDNVISHNKQVIIPNNTMSEEAKKRQVCDVVSKLKNILTKHYQRDFNTRAWNEPIKKLLTLDKIPFDNLIKALDWYSRNIGGDYIPVIESGSALREKYCKLENAMKKISRKQEEIIW